MSRILVHTVTIADCEVDTFAVSGNGGAGKDTSNTGVRVRHRPSGAVGRAVDTRSQSRNKKLAFRRMGLTMQFRSWARLEAARRRGMDARSLEERVDEMMSPENILVEYL